MIRSVSLEKFVWLTVVRGRPGSPDRRVPATRNDNCEGCAENGIGECELCFRKVFCRVQAIDWRAKQNLPGANQAQFSNFAPAWFETFSTTPQQGLIQLDVNFGRNCRGWGLTSGGWTLLE
ncbi:MAG TPA: hypothetical protein VM452_10470, partial [Caulifigura sp.]|nr:hypothetical protein [Caulifigura sp.]